MTFFIFFVLLIGMMLNFYGFDPESILVFYSFWMFGILTLTGSIYLIHKNKFSTVFENTSVSIELLSGLVFLVTGYFLIVKMGYLSAIIPLTILLFVTIFSCIILIMFRNLWSKK